MRILVVEATQGAVNSPEGCYLGGTTEKPICLKCSSNVKDVVKLYCQCLNVGFICIDHFRQNYAPFLVHVCEKSGLDVKFSAHSG